MEINEAHKRLLMKLGLVPEDFRRFDGKFVSYEYEEEKGVRLYDPYYRTSYGEYIGIDGWSAWSSENDTFMSDILKMSEERVPQAVDQPTRERAVTEALKKKFGKGSEKKGG